MTAPYASIVQHYEDCLARHGDSHRGVDWPNAADAQKRYQVMLDLIRPDSGPCSLLDFGCGASHLYQYMLDQGIQQASYAGLDMSIAFCELSRRKYPGINYICANVLDSPECLGEFDYIVMNGVFTEKRDLSFEQMFDYMKKLLRLVFSRSRRGIAFNVMSKQVDWERDDLFHMPFGDLTDFLVKELSRHFVIRNDYGLYEYSVYVYKEHS